jgi:3',5'-cyclic AMP phosphodiesterase CpdA
VVIGQLSDPHLTTPVANSPARLGLKRLLGYLSWRRKRRHRHRREILADVVADIRSQALDHLLVSGDLTHLGLPGECREALTWLRELGPADRVSVIPGNHDVLVADDWAATVGLWRNYFSSTADEAPGDGAFPFLRCCGAVALIGLNSSVPTAPLMADGRMGVAQRERLGPLLEALGRESCFRLVFLHHSPLPDGHAWRKRLRDADALLALLRDAGVELVVHGHGHHEALTTVDTAAGPMLVVGAPSASLAGEFAAGWNLYRIAPVAGGWSVRIDLHRHGHTGMVLRDSVEHVLSRGAVGA